MAIPYSRTVFAGLPWYSLLIVTGILAAVLLLEREERRLALPKDTALDLALVAVPSGIVGARLYYVAMTWQQFAPNPISILYVWEGGVAIYGAVIGGVIGVCCYARIKKLPWLKLLDALVPGVLLAQAIGRWGNYFNMEAYGPEIKNTLFQFFPAGVLIPSGTGYTWHMATFFYESMWNLGGAAALWALRKRQREDGNLLCWYFLIYGSGRFIIEQLREDSLYLGGFRVSQMLSLALCAVSAGVLLWRAAKSRRAAFAVAAIGAALLLARWYCLGSTGLYLGAVLPASLCCLFTAWRAGKSGRRKLILWLLPFVLDLAGLAFAVAQTPLLSFALRLHTLLCSLTLPVYLGVMISILRTNETREGEACPSER